MNAFQERHFFVLAAALALLTLAAGAGDAQTTSLIRTFAGGGTSAGDTLAAGARLETPVGVAVDGQGNAFIADSRAHRVRRVDARTGLLTTVAGTGDFGFSGDGGPATQAVLNRPTGVAVDGQGNVFIADRGNRRVRRVDGGTGVLTTFAGTGQAGFAGDGGPATQAQFYEIVGLAVDGAGNLLIVDGGGALESGLIVGNHRIRRVAAATGVITTVAGTGIPTYSGDGGPAAAAALAFPAAVAVDANGRVLIADAGNHRVRAVDPVTGRIETVAGVGEDPFTGEGTYGGDGGAALSANLNTPAGLAVDGQGNVFISDQGNQRVRRVDARTGVIATVAGTGAADFGGDGGPGFLARLNLPAGLAVLPSGDLLIADLGNGLVRRLSGPSVLTPYAEALPGLVFGGVTVQTSRTQQVFLRNRGNAPLRVLGVGSDLPVFTVRDTSLSVAAGDSVAFAVAFTPVIAGRVTGRLTVSVDDPRGAVTVSLTGQGAVPDIDVPADSLNFGPVVVGRPDTLSLSVYNLGAGQLVVRSASVPDSQFAPLDSVFTLASGQSRALRVVFSPKAPGERVSALTIRSNDPDEGAVSVRLRGLGRVARSGGFRAVGDSTGLGGPGREFGVAWGDFNGDGRPDLYVARSGGRAGSLYRNEGEGKFTDVAAEAGVTNDRDGSGAVWGDYDNDGDPDLFVTNFSQPNRLYRNDGGGRFTDVASGAGLDAVGAGMGGAWADFDNDGDLDLFVANFGPCRLYRNGGDGRFTDVAAALGVADSLGSSVQPAWGDYDGDGRIDLYVAASGKDHLYHNDGRVAGRSGESTEGWRFADVGDSLRVVDNAPSFGAAWGDYDNDGDLDLFVTGFNSPCHLYRNDGGGSFTDVEARLFPEDDGRWKARGGAWVDFDNDGDLDLYVVRSGQTNLLYQNDGSTGLTTGGAAFTEVGARLGVDLKADGRGAAVADFDGDGAPDLYVSAQDRPGRLYWNQQADGGWVAAQLVGTESAKDAIGARVRAVTGGRTLLQEVSGGSSHLSQNGATLLFGVGRGERVDSLVIRWSSGIVQVLKNLPEGQLARVVETPPSPPVRVALTSSSPALIANGTSLALLTATVVDAGGERFLGSRATVSFRIASGPGELIGPASVPAQDGAASAQFRSAALVPGRAVIAARVEGLTEGQVQIDLLPPPKAWTIASVAGVPQTPGRTGDSGPADRALLNSPMGIARDSSGTLYIADAQNRVVRRVDGGTVAISTVAGNGRNITTANLSAGDNGKALNAEMNQPTDVLVTRDGRLLIVDETGHRIRQVSLRDSIISAMAGLPQAQGSYGGDGGPATEAQLNAPASAALDRQGNLFIADTGNHRVRRVDAGTGIITTVAGDGRQGFSGDGLPAARASLSQPSGVAVDSLGNLFIADTGNHRVRRVDAATGGITTVAGDGRQGFSGDGGPGTGASLNGPRRVAVDGVGNLIIADTGNHRLRAVDARGLILTVAGTGNGGFNGQAGQDAAKVDLNDPRGMAPGKPGEVYLSDTRNHVVRLLTFQAQETPPGPSAGADFDGDGVVEFNDFFAFVGQFGTKDGAPGWDSRFDLAKDGVVDFNDFFVFAEQFGRKLNKLAVFSP